jgi:outer membrane protein TolC
MKRVIKYIALAIAVFGSWGACSAQSLVSLLAEADSTNLELKALYQEYLVALQKAPQVSQLPEPEVGLGVFPLPVETRLGPQWVRLSATQMLPWKGTLDARRDVALSKARTQFERIAATQLVLHYQIKQAYFRLYEMEKKQQILMQSISIFNILESVATTNVETGHANLADVLRIQIRIRDLEEELVILENQKKKELAVINRLLNRSAGTPVGITDTLLLADPVIDLDALLAEISANHPMIRMFGLQQETLELEMKLNVLEGKPSFALGVDYINVGKRDDADPLHNGRDILSPRIGVRIPLYRDKYRAREQEEKLRIAALEIRKNDQILGFRNALETALADLEEGRIKYDLYSEQRVTIQSVIDLLLTEYSAEGSGFIDLMQFENQLVQYNLMTLSAIVKTHIALAEIERYIP